ncbi:MAG: hypothetical protein HYV07_20920 [Deltaproteobacteria bacterium]|nr:hypothetical protein [Deltaproteobacteria bacterium]
MLGLEKPLEQLAVKLGVPKLSTFYDFSALEEEFGEHLLEGAEESSGSWFDPGQALRTVKALHEHLVKHPGDLGLEPDPSRQHWPGRLMEELSGTVGVLERAVLETKRFRLRIVS